MCSDGLSPHCVHACRTKGGETTPLRRDSVRAADQSPEKTMLLFFSRSPRFQIDEHLRARAVFSMTAEKRKQETSKARKNNKMCVRPVFVQLLSSIFVRISMLRDKCKHSNTLTVCIAHTRLSPFLFFIFIIECNQQFTFLSPSRSPLRGTIFLELVV